MENKQLIVLIGAARSGTKACRDLFGTNPSISVIPYDINYIWSIGNEEHENDLFTPDSISKKKKEKIVKFITKYYGENNLLVEKTVSNTIRVPFIQSIFPNAKFIFLYRDGLDVVESVDRQWDKKVEKNYILKKLRHVPFKQLVNYGFKFFKRNLNKTKSDYFWGVKTPDLIKNLNSQSRIEAIANQWDFCVSKMLKDRDAIKNENLVDVFYEDLVTNPKKTVERINKKLNITLDLDAFDFGYIKTGNVGKATTRLDDKTIALIKNTISETQKNVLNLKQSLNQ